MSSKIKRCVAALALSALFSVKAAFGQTPLAAKLDNRPNVLIIVADDLGYGDLSAQGDTQIETPNIDSIAKNGIRFTNGYVTGPYCSPTRAGLISGRYQERHGHDFNPDGEYDDGPEVG